MNVLKKNDFVFNTNKVNNNVELTIKILNTDAIYKGIIQNNLEKFGFKKYYLPDHIINCIMMSDELNVNFNNDNGLMYLNFSHIQFEPNKIYNQNITIELKQIFTLDANIVNSNDLDEIKKLTKSAVSYVQILENRINELNTYIKELEDEKKPNYEN